MIINIFNEEDMCMTKEKDSTIPIENGESETILQTIISFLTMFIPVTLVKRILSLLFIAAGLDNDSICKLTGCGGSTIRKLRKDMREKSIPELLVVRGGGRKAKSVGIENEILSELENGNYHTHRQIADMIREKFGVTMSESAVGRFLKKTASKS